MNQNQLKKRYIKNVIAAYTTGSYITNRNKELRHKQKQKTNLLTCSSYMWRNSAKLFFCGGETLSSTPSSGLIRTPASSNSSCCSSGRLELPFALITSTYIDFSFIHVEAAASILVESIFSVDIIPFGEQMIKLLWLWLWFPY